ncbi:polymorphic toxin-type HINT domain-containing protein [Actinomycetes bacterium KLBMP 9797]
MKPRKAEPAGAPPVASWPAAGAAVLDVATARRGAATTTRVGGLPVAATAIAGAAAPTRVRVEVMDRRRATKANVDGALVRVTRADGDTRAGRVRLTLDYREFGAAYGGDYGSRLRLVRLPECALTTPERSECRPKPVPTTNNTESDTLAAGVETNGASGTLFAVAATDASSQGTYAATKLSPSSQWSVAPSTGAFTWSYPLRMPPVPGSNAPAISFAYSSQTVDGRTAATNNQGSWVGEGFSYEPGYIERRYKPCADDGHTGTADLCWAYDNAIIMLNGRSTELLKTDNGWRFANDDGSKVERLTNTVNGDNDNEYWRITTADGTQYHYGLNRLPGWSATKEETASTWTVPVFGDDSGEPCYDATFANAHCHQAWRWSLDYVKDVHGNVASYFYEREINYYARGARTDVNGVAYHRAGWLKRIDYGQRDNGVYTTNAPARVQFTTAERCLEATGCGPGDLNDSTALRWPDVPWDRNCAANSKCKTDQVAPTFWTRKRLTKITTEVRFGGAWTPVDSWTLNHLFTNNADASRSLWLHTITHTGHVGGTAALPAVTLNSLQLPNRIDIAGDNISALIRPRIATVYTDAGAQVDVNYAPADCAAGSLPTAGNSTKRCYPVRWNPVSSSGEPFTDWFHKYVVSDVIETDRVGGAPDMVTAYEYVGDAAWRHTKPDGIVEAKYLTWSEWRGYGKVRVRQGDGQTMTTRTEHTYLRGMHGDKDPDGGTRTVTVTDSAGTSHTDHDELSGFQLETSTFDGNNQIDRVITAPWLHHTGTQSHTWGSRKSAFVKTASTRGFTALAAGGWRETKSSSTYEPTIGRVVVTEDLGDVATDADDRCTRTTYGDNEGIWLRTLVARVETVTVKCATTPNRATQVLTDKRTSFDGKAFGVAPTEGNPTKTEQLASHDGTTPTYVTVAESTYDAYGRPLVVKDAVGTATTTAYTETEGITTKKVETSPLGHGTTTEYAVAWGAPIAQTDPNNKRSDLAYDPLGRLVSVWLADRSKLSGVTPNIKYSYSTPVDAAWSVKTEKIENDATYGAEYQIYDGHLRPRQVQTEGPENGRLIADTFYTPTGKLAKTHGTYFAANAPSGALWPVNNGDVDAQTLYVYDGADRVKAEITAVAGVERWRTTTTYGGDRTHVDPPTGATPTTTVVNAAGQTTELWQYKGDSPTGTDVVKTKYSYNQAGQLASVVDPAGITWRYEYDQRGRKTKSVDPDSGTTTYQYDDLDRLVSSTDGRGVTLTNVYDIVGRKRATYQGSADTGTKLAEWVYDGVARGELHYSARYVNGQQYLIINTTLDAFYRPIKTAYVLPKADIGDKLGGRYEFATTYNSDGTIQSAGWPAAGGFAAEGVTYGYDEIQRATSVTGATSYIPEITYAQTGEVLRTRLSTGGKTAWLSYAYDRGTKRLTQSRLDRQNLTVPDIHARYTYDDAGNILSIADTPEGGQRDIQCFTHDFLRRTEEAWTTASTAADPCAGGPAASGVGGPAPYHHEYEYDSTGNRTVETKQGLGGAGDVTREYKYPVAGQPQPHTLDEVVEETSAGDRLYTYDYDDAGNLERRVQVGQEQNFTWDAEGHLASVTEGGNTTSFLYTADGDRLVRKEQNATTVYLPGMELRLDHTTQVVDPTRYLSAPGGGTIVRTVKGHYFLAGDHHGTAVAAVDATTGAIEHRRSTPFGEQRGTQPGAWPGEKGFVGGTKDATTGLTHLGAREYDPATGRFISIDPIIDVNDPQQMNGYAYGNNNPASYSDPDGLKSCSDDRCGPGADYEDHNGDYVDVDGHNDGCGGCSGSVDPTVPKRKKTTAGGNDRRNREMEKAKQLLIAAAKALGKIAMDELGITDALDCFTKGDLGGCIETAINIATTFVGGLVAKIARKYGAPWKWDDAARLGKRIYNLLGNLVDGVKKFFKARSLPDCARNSFMPGTLVLLANGSTKPIEEIDVGEVVLATDPETGVTAGKTVVATIVGSGAKNLVRVTVDTGEQTAEVVATAGHPFWVPELGDWLDATDLRPGQWLRTSAGTWVQITAIERWSQAATVHNLTIPDIHTYYVSVAQASVLVHNSDAPWWDTGDDGDDDYDEYDDMPRDEKMQRGSNRASNKKVDYEMRRAGLDPKDRTAREEVHRGIGDRKLDGNANVGRDDLREAIDDVGDAC